MSLHSIYALREELKMCRRIKGLLAGTGVSSVIADEIHACQVGLKTQKAILCEDLKSIDVDPLCLALDVESDHWLILDFEFSVANGRLDRWMFCSLSKLQQIQVSHLLNSFSHE